MNNETVKQVTIKELYDLTETAAKPLLESVTYPWEALPKIKDFIIELGNSLDPEEYEKRGENIWIHKSATVFDSDYWKRYRGQTVCIYSWKCFSGR